MFSAQGGNYSKPDIFCLFNSRFQTSNMWWRLHYRRQRQPLHVTPKNHKTQPVLTIESLITIHRNLYRQAQKVRSNFQRTKKTKNKMTHAPTMPNMPSIQKVYCKPLFLLNNYFFLVLAWFAYVNILSCFFNKNVKHKKYVFM
jgi:hypothetical protein